MTDATITLRDPLTLDTRDALKEQVRSLVATGAELVTIDLSECPMIDASGLGSLYALSLDARHQGARVRLVPGSAHLEFFRSAGLDQRFDLADAAGSTDLSG